jgi:hypothetical protein
MARTNAAWLVPWIAICASCGSGDSSQAAFGDDGGGVSMSDASTGDSPTATRDGGGGDASVPTTDGGPTHADAAGDDGGCSAGPAAPSDAPGCSGTTLFARPSDPGARGPWAVGAHTSTVAGFTTEVWYPAAWGSERCQSKATYDLREHLPTSEQKKIPDSANPLQICDCYRDLPIDAAHGPYPVITFIHGTAAFRTQSLTFATHWASRGFVVVSSDHPGIQLKDILTSFAGIGSADEAGDAVKVLTAIFAAGQAPADLGFVAGHLDAKRMAAIGHSAGGQAVSGLSSKYPGLQVIIPMAAGGVTAGGDLATSLVMSAADDGIAQPSGQTSGYSSTPAPKRFVQIANAGHLVFSDLCDIGASQGGLLAVAVKYGVMGASTLASLANDGCPWQTGKSYTAITPQQGWAVVDFATSAVLEGTLMCDTTMAAQIAGIQQAVPNVASYQEQLQ